ncbi:4Fe-4S dicluster protein [Dyadobacter jejuensis]|uniref:4Fe-4S dicluster protein n=1 Tax=Dyadobacter jejuensis TaxID=1082580 RepID=A0A316B1S8_9BACT|nr:(Fe-S)-binding protein [Dyadobacter jejuensis]PWJ56517.1 4Fe-4S dicluster protein [Dyadobacter jejuensis]
MVLAQQILFLAIFGTACWLIYQRVTLISRTIRLGKAEDRLDQPSRRLSTMLRIAFGQKKMFDRPVVGLLHFVVYAGFLLINIEVLEIVLDGLLGKHRILAPLLGGFYTVLIGFFEILALGVLLACLLFLVRRWILKVDRLQASRHREMNGWPELDASVILILEIVLMIAILSMNGADLALQRLGSSHYTPTGPFLISQALLPIFTNWNEANLILFERIAWWLHIVGILGFAVYVTYSKHLHIALAFPNTYFAKLTPMGTMQNMPEITGEVQAMLGLPTDNPGQAAVVPDRFGAKDVSDLSWKSLMDAYSCTECGRCTSACPANMTGKLLSPRKIMMDTRDRLEDLGRNMQQNGGKVVDDGKSLLGDYILDEELLACTSCNACVQECPILINPLDIILQLRRYRVMEEAQAPASWNAMFQNLETNQAPWKFSPADRFNWASGRSS